MKEFIRSSQKGQSLVLVTLFIIALLAMLALVLDGGNGYLKRRQAQNAADAGALAGARKYCSDPADLVGAIEIADEYVKKNNAISIVGYPYIDEINHSVTAATTITFDTFFGSIIRQPTNTTNAIAEAGCFGACLAKGVLPVVWICKPEGGTFPPGVNVSCDDLAIPWDTLQGYLEDPPVLPIPEPGEPEPKPCTFIDKANKADHKWVCPELTIVIDNIDVDNLQCDSVGGILDCDFDEDGEDDYVSADNRGWADLDGGAGEPSQCDPNNDNGGEGRTELGYWIKNGYDCDFWNHTWVGDQSGGPLALLKDIEARIIADPEEGRLIMLPVFDWTCPSDPTGRTGTDDCNWHDNLPVPPHHRQDDIVHFFNSTPNYYHIDHFSLFYITCIQTQKGECPGATKFYEDNWGLFHGGGDPIDGADYNAVEGYFLTEYIPNLSGKCEYDPNGPFTVYLDK